MSEIDAKGLLKALGLSEDEAAVRVTVVDEDGNERAVVEPDPEIDAQVRRSITEMGEYGANLHMAGSTMGTIVNAMGKAYMAILKVEDGAEREDLFHDACHLLLQQIDTVRALLASGMPCLKGKTDNTKEKAAKLH